MEGHAAPGALLQVLALVLDVVHLGEDGPGVGGDQAGAPDEEDDSLGSAHAGPGGEGEGVADGLVPGVVVLTGQSYNQIWRGSSPFYGEGHNCQYRGVDQSLIDDNLYVTGRLEIEG